MHSMPYYLAATSRFFNLRHRNFCVRLLVVIMVIINPLLKSYSGAKVNENNPVEIKTKLREVASSIVNGNGEIYGLIVSKSDFTVMKSSKTVYYRRGQIMDYYLYDSVIGLDKDDLYAVPLASEIYLVELQSVFNSNKDIDRFWNRHFLKVDDLIGQEIVAIGKLNGRQRTQRLQELKGLVSKEFDSLWEDVFRFARENNYTLKKSSIGGASPNEYYHVSVEITPKSGILRVLPELKYRIYRSTGRPESMWNWLTISTGNSDMLGTYYYTATWPGQKRLTGTLEIKDDSSIKFTPSKLDIRK